MDLDGAGPATAEHPITGSSGKVAFGTGSQVDPSLMCKDAGGGGNFNLIDTVAYGTRYTGTVDFGSAFGSDLPTTGTDGIRLQGPICFLGCSPARDNARFVY